jgi:phage baseplate assembly protein W
MATILKDSREYVDLDFTFSMHPVTKNVSIKKKSNAVKQSVLNLMQLKGGEKPFHPEIKSPIYDYLFENASPVMQLVLESEVIKYLSIYEPRLDIETVNISFPSANSLNCTIVGYIVNLQEPLVINVLVDRLR